MLSAFINLVKTFVMYVAHCLTIKSARKKFERDFDRSNNYFYVTVKPGILVHSELSSLEMKCLEDLQAQGYKASIT